VKPDCVRVAPGAKVFNDGLVDLLFGHLVLLNAVGVKANAVPPPIRVDALGRLLAPIFCLHGDALNAAGNNHDN
jgi:hypothetical protein